MNFAMYSYYLLAKVDPNDDLHNALVFELWQGVSDIMIFYLLTSSAIHSSWIMS